MDALAQRNVDLRGVIEDQCAPAKLIRAISNGGWDIPHEHNDSIIVRSEAPFACCRACFRSRGAFADWDM